MSAFATGGQQSACQNCFSCGLRALSLSIKTEPQVLSSPTICLSHTPHVTTPARTRPQHFAPVSSSADYLVIAEIRTQLLLLSIL